MKTLGRLVRLSLAPSAIADAAGGVVLGAGLWPDGRAPWLQIGAALCVYHGGMALNDWADRAEDARLRPDRPIPSGKLSATSAFAIAVGLMLTGVALAWLASPTVGLVMAGVALSAALYDVAARGAVRGPFLLGACRAGNLGAATLLGAQAVGRSFDVWLAVPILIYGFYVFVVSCLGRMEDAEDCEPLGKRPAYLIVVAALLILFAAIVARSGEALGMVAQLALASYALISLVIAADVHAEWTRPRVMRAMGLCLRRLLVFPILFALSCPAPTGFVVAGLLLTGWPISTALRRVFPPS